MLAGFRLNEGAFCASFAAQTFRHQSTENKILYRYTKKSPQNNWSVLFITNASELITTYNKVLRQRKPTKSHSFYTRYIAR